MPAIAASKGYRAQQPSQILFIYSTVLSAVQCLSVITDEFSSSSFAFAQSVNTPHSCVLCVSEMIK